MWLNMPTATGITRSRIAFFAAISALSLASLGYYVYQLRAAYPPSRTTRLHRRNATRHARRSRQRRTRISEEDEPETASIAASEHGNDDNDNDGYSNSNTRDRHSQRDTPYHSNSDSESEEEGSAARGDEEDAHEGSAEYSSRAGHNIVGLLFRVSEDNARRNAYVHRGCQCNSCSTVPIRGIRYRCVNCADFDLCEACESQSLHNKNHVFLKIKVPVPPAGLRSIQPVLYTGDPDNCVRILPKAIINKLCRETGFERSTLEAHWERWTFMANTEWREDPDDLCLAMDRKTFDRCIAHNGTSRHLPPNLVHDRMFAFFDQNGDGLISFREYLHGLAYRSKKERLRKVFDGYDIDGDGYVDRKDFLRMFRAYFTIFKQIHKDILDGLDTQAMSLLDTQQLITSRTPLSSFFGRDESVPRADLDDSRIAGKTLQPNGSVSLPSPLSSVVQPSEQEIASRAEVLSAVFTINAAHEPTRADSIMQNILPNALLSPPNDINALLNLITNVSNNRGPISRSNNPMSFASSSRAGHTVLDEVLDSIDDDSATNSGDARYNSPSTEDLNNMPESNQGRDISSQPPHGHELTDGERKLQRRVRRRMFDRWKRRQFYLDVEEGGQAPSGWDSDEDIVEAISVMANPDPEHVSFNTRRDSTRSRSSSKVRFADQDDEFETRSNASTSSRSIPERWGGFDIPEAERDLGKEILYLTAQEAYNEILDVFFKEKEDLAVKAAETREFRHQHRDLMDTLLPHGSLKSSSRDHARDPRNSAASHRQKPETTSNENDPTMGSAQHESDESGAASASDGIDQSSQLTSPTSDSAPISHTKSSGNSHQNNDNDNGSASDSDDAITEILKEMVEIYRDPTMPQFRPNNTDTVHETPAVTTTALSLIDQDAPKPLSSERKTRSSRNKDSMLRKLRKYNDAEVEAVERRGFGKLSFAEFEKIYREQEAQYRMDYLETWIDIYMP
ncbi:hypothetical protein Cpir12675_000902 [Ceratocystis pirilliformis]|uniref:Protein ref(2)P n=1 Tax=Ceratocystis pirilliformis TaxID=259994 RepID=A0ABR3ZIE1_9PEZI